MHEQIVLRLRRLKLRRITPQRPPQTRPPNLQMLQVFRIKQNNQSTKIIKVPRMPRIGLRFLEPSPRSSDVEHHEKENASYAIKNV